MLMLRGLAGGLIQIAMFAVLLFVPAGTWQWPRALQFLAVYGILMLVSIIALARLAPASLEARLQAPASKSQPAADRAVTAILILVLLAWFAFIPIDIFRLRLLAPPALVISVFGAVIFLAGYGLLMAAIFQNAFAAPIVKDQSERGQVLVDTGLYGRLRHPFYLGFLLFLVGMGLWLESYASVLALPLVFGILVARIFVEEKTLRETLPGYTGYMRRVPCRIIPFVW